MLIYKFLEAKWAFDDILKGRVKLSEIDKVNDVFELEPFSYRNEREKALFFRWKTEVNNRFVLLSGSKISSSLHLWTHYAESNRGLCLVFEVIKDDYGWAVEYESDLKPWNQFAKEWLATGEKLDDQKKVLMKALSTKAKEYENDKEIRFWAIKKEVDFKSGLYFFDFNTAESPLKLVGVILGVQCAPKLSIKWRLKMYFKHRQKIGIVDCLSSNFKQFLQIMYPDTQLFQASKSPNEFKIEKGDPL